MTMVPQGLLPMVPPRASKPASVVTAAGMGEVQLNIGVGWGGQVTFKVQQVAVAQPMKGAQSGRAVRETVRQYCVPSAGTIILAVVPATIIVV